MMRSPSVPLSEYDSGSPDPLASSTNSERVDSRPSRRATPSTSKKQHTPKSSVESISILPPSSPSRTVTEQTLSPWKIRVTVEAEPEDPMEGLTRTTTTTVKVPLREEGSSTSRTNQRPKRSQSKPRSRTGSPAKDRQRSVTPIGGRRRRQSVTDLDIVVLGDDAEEDEWAPRSRKSSPSKVKTTRKGSRPRSQSVESTSEVLNSMNVHDDGNASTVEVSPELRQIDLNKVSVRPRANSTKQRVDLVDKPNSEPALVSKHSLPAIATRRVSNNSIMSYPTPSPTASERGNSDGIEKGLEEQHDQIEGFDTIMESEGFTMIDLDSIPSVRQMLSSPLENETSNPRHLSPISERESSVQRKVPSSAAKEPRPASRAIPPHLQLIEDESEISSTVPSSPPVFQPRPQLPSQKSPLSHLLPPPMTASQPRNRLVTPHTLSSPKLPSPPRQAVSKDRSSPDSAQALKAGIMLQGAVVDPVRDSTVLAAATQNAPKEMTHVRSSSEEIFEGFDSGTKRELRAGLRFGEELAKRQQPLSMISRPATNKQGADLPPQIWRGESVTSRTPIQHSQDERSTKLQKSPKLSTSALRSSSSSSLQGDQISLDRKARQAREHRPERQAVSTQIDTARPDQIIVVNNDDESSNEGFAHRHEDISMQDVAMDDGDDDIWLEEAKDASSSPRQDGDQSELLTESEQHSQHDRARDVIEQPRRSAIPSPWKRGEQTEDGSSVFTTGEEMSGLFWKEPQGQDNIHFGDAAIKNVRDQIRTSGVNAFAERRNSGAFDIEKMLGTPKRIRESLEREKDRREPSGGKNDASSETNPETDEDIFSYEGGEGDSQPSIYSEDMSDKSDVQPEDVPVNLDESTATESGMTPPQTTRPRFALSPSAARPPTPRSAMKGTRQSFGATNRDFSGDIDQAGRKVVFAQRSRGVNVDWVESSSSVLSESAEASSPIVDHQRHHGERRQAHSLSSPIAVREENREQPTVEAQDRHQQEQPDIEAAPPEPAQKSWFGWLRKGTQPETVAKDDVPSSVSSLDGMTEPKEQTTPPSSERDLAQNWAPTSRHTQPSQPKPKSQSMSKTKPTPSRHQTSIVPSYLLAPSYPSDPTRSISVPLSVSGSVFSTTHFRTLHIIHAKSQRPRFHAPSFASCRPEIRDLAHSGWKLGVDESDAGLGAFEWSFGELEARTLERFCREVEFGYLFRGDRGTEAEVEVEVKKWLEGGGGIWSGVVSHGGDPRVPWGWDVQRLATWLGRVVVGEVVRREEFSG